VKRIPRRLTLRERMAHYTTKLMGEDACWQWYGSLNGTGYARLEFKGKSLFAHRVTWELFNGPIPAGMCVCHRCDNRRCVNPAHLWLGTKGENNADRDRKGRTSRGRERAIASAKLIEAQVIEIRDAAGKQRDIARAYGISQNHVSRIKRGLHWAHIAEGA
jgi:hypothetical protein